jgi:hypothetical protein
VKVEAIRGYIFPVYNIDQPTPNQSHIASAKPAVYKCLLRSRWVVMISFCDNRPFDEDFSTLSRFDVFSIVVDNSKVFQVISGQKAQSQLRNNRI